MSSQHGYQVELSELGNQVTALAAIGHQTNGIAESARQLAAQVPQLGTAPVALHLAARLQEVAGTSAQAISSASTSLNGYHRALQETISGYLENEANIADSLRGES